MVDAFSILVENMYLFRYIVSKLLYQHAKPKAWSKTNIPAIKACTMTYISGITLLSWQGTPRLLQPFRVSCQVFTQYSSRLVPLLHYIARQLGSHSNINSTITGFIQTLQCHVSLKGLGLGLMGFVIAQAFTFR